MEIGVGWNEFGPVRVRGVVAQREFVSGEVVVEEEAVASVPMDQLRTCAGCLRSFGAPEDLKRCGCCRVVGYCCEECQRKDWENGHSVECAVFAKSWKKRRKRIPPTVHLVVRVLMMIKERYDSLLSLLGERNEPRLLEIDTSPLELFVSLEDHCEDANLTQKAQWHALAMVVGEVMGIGGEEKGVDGLDGRRLLGVIGRIVCNALAGSDFGYEVGVGEGGKDWDCTLESLWLGLFPKVALMNHACDANCSVSFREGGRVVVRTIRRVKCGEPLTITYIPPHRPALALRSQLKDHYFFTCHCGRCTTELSITPASLRTPSTLPPSLLTGSTRCPSCPTGLCLPISTPSHSIVFICAAGTSPCHSVFPDPKPSHSSSPTVWGGERESEEEGGRSEGGGEGEGGGGEETTKGLEKAQAVVEILVRATKGAQAVAGLGVMEATSTAQALADAMEAAQPLLPAQHWALLEALVAMGVVGEAAGAMEVAETAAMRVRAILEAEAGPTWSTPPTLAIHGPLFPVMLAREARAAWAKKKSMKAAMLANSKLKPTLEAVFGKEHPAARWAMSFAAETHAEATTETKK